VKPTATYFVETHGCQMNVHDSEKIAGLLDGAGYQAAADEAHADVIVINTCAVRERAEEKLYTRLGELREASAESGRRPVLVVAGCVGQQDAATVLRRYRFVDVVVGPRSLASLPALIRGAGAARHALVDVGPGPDLQLAPGASRRRDPVKAAVTIVEGCDEFCAFCVVPHTRGRQRMRSMGEILEEVRQAAGAGHREIQLLGQIVNSYTAPDRPGCDFAALLEAVHEVPGVERIRFASPHPRYVSPRLIQAMRDLPRVCRHLHLPVQSGSTAVLERMRRRYTRESYLDLVARVREAIPAVALSTDMIVGFPGETPEDFDETLSLAATVRFHSMFSFKYSPRPNTLALKRFSDDVGAEEKTRRIVALQQLQRTIQTEIFEAAIGQECDVLVDSTSRRRDWELSGRTEGNTVVNLPGPAEWLGRTVRVRITRAGANSLAGDALSPPLLDSRQPGGLG
jgi:tRNA-2-methylthio-N6-dimethylallyladenosine synthase